jgi:hypothetical protein
MVSEELINGDGRATVALVYKLIGELRVELVSQIGSIDTKLDARFDALLLAIEDLRGALVPAGVCTERYHGIQAEIVAAVKQSEADREKLWETSRSNAAGITELRKLVYQGVGIGIVASMVLAPLVSAIVLQLVNK